MGAEMISACGVARKTGVLSNPARLRFFAVRDRSFASEEVGSETQLVASNEVRLSWETAAFEKVGRESERAAGERGGPAANEGAFSMYE